MNDHPRKRAICRLPSQKGQKFHSEGPCFALVVHWDTTNKCLPSMKYSRMNVSISEWGGVVTVSKNRCLSGSRPVSNIQTKQN